MISKEMVELIKELIKKGDKKVVSMFTDSFLELEGHLGSCLSSIDEEEEPEAYRYTDELSTFANEINEFIKSMKGNN